MPATPRATLPALIEAVRSAIPNDRKARDRGTRRTIKKAMPRDASVPSRPGACLGREPIRHCAPVDGDLEQIKDLDWSLVVDLRQRQQLPTALADEKYYHWLGASGGYGVGSAPGFGPALRSPTRLGRFSVSIQSRRRLMYAPGSCGPRRHRSAGLCRDAQQPRLRPGGHARAAAVQLPQRVASLGKHEPIGTAIGPGHRVSQARESMAWWAKGPTGTRRCSDRDQEPSRS